MKKLIKTAAIAALLLAAGCATNTGLVFVDKPSFEKHGLVVTNFVDNQLYAHIYYDFSNAKDFDPSKLKAELVHNFVPPETEEALYDIQNDPGIWYNYANAMNLAHMGLYTVDGIRILSLPNREAIIKESHPGELVIASFDDIGTYRAIYSED